MNLKKHGINAWWFFCGGIVIIHRVLCLCLLLLWRKQVVLSRRAQEGLRRAGQEDRALGVSVPQACGHEAEIFLRTRRFERLIFKVRAFVERGNIRGWL